VGWPVLMYRLMGHSNGGQGAWHSAARYPERIVGVIAASGWLKIQDYVSYTSL
jgi:pimeloyl-ACP methyl ester carboxylesterase